METPVSPLKQKLSDDLKQAMRAKDNVKVCTIRLLMSSVKNAEILKQASFADADILVVVSKEVKQRQESIEAFKLGNRQDLVDKETAELNILQSYQPKQMTVAEIEAEARRIIKEVGAAGINDKGKVMPKIIAELKGKADGREINAVVTKLLSE